MRTNAMKRHISKWSQAIIETMEPRTLFTAAPISLDPGFATAGVALNLQTPAGGSFLTACNPVNGNIFVLGSDPYPSSSPAFGLQEYTSTGALVTGLGNNGLATPPAPVENGNPVAAAVQSDGKLLVMVQNEISQTTQDFYLSRYTASGALDPTFGTGGTVEYSTQFPTYTSSDTFDLLPNGDIAIPGIVVSGTTDLSAVKVLTTTGAPDPSFGTNGVAAGIAGALQGVTSDSSGNIVAVGYATATPAASPPPQALIERFTPAGKLDPSFGNHGSVIALHASDFLSLYVSSSGISAAGVLDGSSNPVLYQFTSTGQLNTALGAGSGYVSPQLSIIANTYYSAFQPDGKALVFAQNGYTPAIARLNTNGTLDTAFGSGGYVTLSNAVISGLSFEPNGQIVMPYNPGQLPDGSASTLDYDPIRLSANGSPDTSFGPGGIAVSPPLFYTGDAVAALANGQLLIAGEEKAGSEYGIFIERYNANGSLDTTFAPGEGFGGQNGYIFVGPEALPQNSTTNVVALKVDSSGNIYLDEAGVGILRFNSSGQLDKTFGANGTYTNSQADGLLVEVNGQILVSIGTSALVRLSSNGRVDKTFGNAGTVTFPEGFNTLPLGYNQSAGVLAVQSDGKILVGGSTVVASLESEDLAVVRLDANGSVDTSFGSSGMAIADQLPEEDQYNTEEGYTASSSALAVLPSGVIALAGTGGISYKGGRYIGTTVAEFLPTGQLNTSFATYGQTSAFVPDNEAQASSQSLFVQSDGTLVVAGTSYEGGLPFSASSFLIVRYAANGTVDSYLTNDFAPLDVNAEEGPYCNLSQAVAGPNGTIVAIGSIVSTDAGTEGPVLARYITNANALTGTVIGTTGSYQSKGNTAAKAFDGNLSTFFDAPTASGSYVGLDLGSSKVISQISYSPRAGFTSRMVGGVFQASNSATFSSGNVTLYTITTAPSAGVLTTVAVSDATAFRYVRYVGPTNSYCNIAEAQFFGTTPTVSVIGTSGSYNNQGNTIANVFDGNLTTYFDAPSANGAWVGLDLGTAQAITQVSYAPRAGFDSRMVGGMIQASNTPDFSSGVVTAYTITKSPPAGSLTTVTFASVGAYRYWRYIGPAGGYCNIAELAFGGV